MWIRCSMCDDLGGCVGSIVMQSSASVSKEHAEDTFFALVQAQLASGCHAQSIHSTCSRGNSGCDHRLGHVEDDKWLSEWVRARASGSKIFSKTITFNLLTQCVCVFSICVVPKPYCFRMRSLIVLPCRDGGEVKQHRGSVAGDTHSKQILHNFEVQMLEKSTAHKCNTTSHKCNTTSRFSCWRSPQPTSATQHRGSVAGEAHNQQMQHNIEVQLLEKPTTNKWTSTSRFGCWRSPQPTSATQHRGSLAGEAHNKLRKILETNNLHMNRK